VKRRGLDRRAALKRAAGPERRTSLRRSAFKRRPKRHTELERREARAAILFGASVRTQRCCQVCGYNGVFVEAHHVISRQLLRRLLGQKGAPVDPNVLHDPRNGLLLCTDEAHGHRRQGCHGLHTSARRRIPRRALRPENWVFAREHDLAWVLEVEYPEVEAA
jgi:hypothetical protein